MSVTRFSAPFVLAAPRGFLRDAITIFGGSALLAASAHVALPFWPVPLTLQTLAVLVVGAWVGPRLGAMAVLAYLAEGLAGVPVFAAGAGPAVLLGPTGGYLVGYLPAAALAGLAVRRGRPAAPLRAVLVFCASDAVVFAFGLARLAALFDAGKALAVGLAPFLLGEGLKIALAATLVTLGRGLIRR